MKLHNKFYRNITWILALALTACDVLDLTPRISLSETTAYETPERIALAVTGVYDAAQSGFYASGQIRGYPFGAAHVEQGDARGEDVVNTQLFYAITYESTYTPTSANNEYMWGTLYGLINRANVVLEGLEKVVTGSGITVERLNEWKAECRFLRALAHHTLLVHFTRPYSDNPTAPAGGVIYRTKAATNSATVDELIQAGRNTVAECYTLLIQDLDFAETHLPSSRTGALHITRATKAAAVALKTRAYLHMGNFAKVVEEGNKLAAQSAGPFSSAATYGSRSLTATPMGAFGANNKNNVESIFSIENNDVDNSGTNGSLPRMYKTEVSGARGILGISPILWNQTFWPATDFRKTDMATNDGLANSGRGAKFTTKYADHVNQTDNAPIIRYAEVLLNMAEAIQRQAGAVPDARAFELYNAIRKRANPGTAANPIDPATNELSDFATGNDLIQAILNERRIEFVCEGLRWGDIHRLANDPVFGIAGIPAKASRNITNYSILYTGDPTTAFTTHPFIPYSDFRFLWPLPAQEIITNPGVSNQQNPGY